MFAEINGTKLFYKVLPNENTDLTKGTVFVGLHGGPGAEHSGIEAACAGMSSQLPVVLYDQRGSGKSDPLQPEDFSMELFCSDLEKLRLSLGIKKIALMGISFGGMLALEYALRYPDSLDCLMLIVTAPSGDFRQDALKYVDGLNISAEVEEYARKLVYGKLADDNDFTNALAVLNCLYSANDVPAELIKDKLTGKKLTADIINVFFREKADNFDVVDRLEEIKAPTLIVGGNKDWICPVNNSILLHQKMPGSELVIFPEGHHLLFNDENKKFVSIIYKWLKETLNSV